MMTKTINQSMQSMPTLLLSTEGNIKKKTSSDLINKCKRLLSNKDNQYDTKDQQYLSRFNTILRSTISEVEQELKRKSSQFSQTTQSKNIDQLFDIHSEIKLNYEIIKNYKQQMAEIEKKRNKLLDSKYRYDVAKEVITLKEQIKDLEFYCKANRDKRNTNLKKSQVVLKPIKPQQQSQVKQQISPQSQQTQQGQKSRQASQPQVPVSPVSSFKRYKEQDALTVKDIEIRDPGTLIEKNNMVSEQLDLYLGRNRKLEDKVQNLRDLVAGLQRKSLKIDDQFAELQEYARFNEICEQPGMEQRFKKFQGRIVTLDRNLVINKNMYELRIEEQQRGLEEIKQVAQERQMKAFVLRGDIEKLEKQIIELRAIQQNMGMNAAITLPNTKKTFIDALNFNGEHSFLNHNQSFFSEQTKEQRQQYIDIDENEDEIEVAEGIANQYLDDIFVSIYEKYSQIG